MLRSRSFLAAALGLLVSSLVAFPAAGQSVPPEGSRFSASATGTALYVGALPPDVGHVAVRAGFSGATVSAGGRILPTTDEFGAKVATGGAGRHAEARGRGLDVNGLVVAGAAEAAAPPTPAPVADEVSLVDIPNVASVSLARGEAAPAWSNQTCVAGRPLSFGSGRALGVVLPMAAVDAAHSDATAELRPTGNTISVVAEAHQGAATIHLLPGTPEQTTIEVLGETVLRARADGNPGGAALEYAAVGTDPAAPFLRITRGKEVVQLTSQQVFGGGVALAQTPVMEVRIGEAPRGFDKAGGARPFVAAEGTAASAVVDLVRVQLLTGGPGEVLDVRIGHLEAEVAVPAGGVRCPVPASNGVDKNQSTLAGSPARRNGRRNVPDTPSHGLASGVMATKSGPPIGPFPHAVETDEQKEEYDKLRRRVLWKMPYGLYVVGARDGERRNGMTLNWASQVSFEPKLVGISVEKIAFTHELIAAGGMFSLNVLSREDRAIVRKFVKPVEVDPEARTLNGFPFHDGRTGAPILDQAVAFVDCEVRNPVDCGGHTLFIGEVVDSGFQVDDEEADVLRMEDTRMSYGG